MATDCPNGRFTPTEYRLLALLEDGQPHERHELVACLEDDLSEWRNVSPHLASIRKKLRENRRDIICQVLNRRFVYRMIGLLSHKG